MRILFTTSPTFSHTTPMVPLAQAARLAGHQVVFAGGEVTRRTAAGAGLSVLDPAPGQDVGEPHRSFMADESNHNLPPEKAVGAFVGMLSTIGQMMLPGLVDAARGWKADVVVTPAWMPWGLVAARAAGALGVMHGIGLRYPAVPWMADEPPEVARRHGVTQFPEHCDAEVSLIPESLDQFSPVSPGEVPFPVLSMQPCTYNGSGEVQPWVLRKQRRHRVAVTMGTTSADHGWPEVLDAVVRGAADEDTEVIIATGGVDVSAILGDVPESVRVVDFVPLDTLLASCDAIVHHSGMSSMFSAFCAGVPQVALPRSVGDSPMNAHVMTSGGAGVAVTRSEATPELVREALHDVIHEPSYRDACAGIVSTMEAMPSPHDVVAQLAGLAASGAQPSAA
ncbi:glycosyltransferase [Haloactinopolyspora alba]|uniref:Glycosyltransferase n=1 Tax=Haloactinopolyspora alba TaxID=648780 RepID=A0A2P8E925_9ACTN|nr:glycosyltransferase [Haloactinopolyspora alba]PSL05976.1 glycosyltransferase [Haloactinopolyspora alba]